MWIALDQFSRAMIDAAVANVVLLSAIATAGVITRQPARRIALVQAGAYASLLMLPLAAFAPLPRVYPVDWLLRAGLVPPSLVPESDPADVAIATTVGPPGEVPPRRSLPDSPVEWPAGEPLVRSGALLYLTGASLGLAWMGLGLAAFRRLVNQSREPGEALRDVFDALAVDLDRSPPPPSLRVSSRLRSPVSGGLLRPVVIVPAEIDRDDFDRDALRLILLHELAHADRDDAWFNALASVAQLLWFFLPHPWWLRGQMRIDQEFLADREAAGGLGESTRYAHWLVGLSRGRSGRDAPAPEAIARPQRAWSEHGFDTPLLQRVAMLLYCPFALEGRPPRRYVVLVAAVVMLAALPLSTFRVVAPVDPAAITHQARARDPLMRNFNLPEFVVVPSRSSTTADAYVLPLALPQVFRLQAEIVANRRSLARLRIAGCPVAPDTAPVPGHADDDPDAVHRYTLRRGYDGLRASLDGVAFQLDPKLLEGRRWLSFAPADEIVVIRDLVVIW